MLLMDAVVCNVIYVDRAIEEDRLVRAQPDQVDGQDGASQAFESSSVEENVKVLLHIFKESESSFTHWHRLSLPCPPPLPALLNSL